MILMMKDWVFKAFFQTEALHNIGSLRVKHRWYSCQSARAMAGVCWVCCMEQISLFDLLTRVGNTWVNTSAQHLKAARKDGLTQA
jgi:hypothetical protein